MQARMHTHTHTFLVSISFHKLSSQLKKSQFAAVPEWLKCQHDINENKKSNSTLHTHAQPLMAVKPNVKEKERVVFVKLAQRYIQTVHLTR